MKAIIVLGMHRSATSMTARALHKSGEVYMGNKLILGLNDNPKGHYEQKPIVLLNDKILNSAGGTWDNPPKHEDILAQFDKFKDKIKLLINEVKQHAKKNKMVSYGFKDPRLNLTIELFLPFLDKPQFIVCFRNEYDVALSLQKRNNISIKDGMKLAREYNKRAQQFISDFYSK